MSLSLASNTTASQLAQFCARLIQERKRLGLNQSEFGSLAGVTKQAQIRYEKGARSPDANYLMALRAAGVDIASLFAVECAAGESTAINSTPQLAQFCARLIQQRKRLGLNQADFGAKGGVTGRSQRSYEKGTRLPDANYLLNLQAAGLDPHFLFGGHGHHDASTQQVLRLWQAVCADMQQAVLDTLAAAAKAMEAT